MIRKAAGMILLSLFFTALGLAGGWQAASVKSAGAGGGHGHSHGGHSHGGGEEHGGNGHGAAISFSPQSLKNQGITIEAVEPGSYTVTKEIAAELVEMPQAHRPLRVPIGGRVQEVFVSSGSMVKAGEPLLSLVREALPRATLDFTESILRPTDEEFHTAIGDLQRASLEIKLSQTEFDRLNALNDGREIPLVPKKEIIEAENALLRAKTGREIAAEILSKHGLSEKQIEAAAAGEHPVPDAEVWLEALKRNSLWPKTANDVFDILPDNVGKTRWAIATLGELASANLLGDALTEWIGKEKEAGEHFLELGGLLQRGSTLAEIKDLFSAGAFSEIVIVRAPNSAPDWDVEEVAVRTGQKVSAGDTVLELKDSQTLYLKAKPLGDERELLAKALKNGSALDAKAMILGSGPDLKGLELLKISMDENDATLSAILSVANFPLELKKTADGKIYRSWALQPGVAYSLRVPISVMENVYVLKASALAEDGPDKVLYLADGDSFKAIPVEVLYQNHEVAIVGGSSKVFPGDRIATSGAYAIYLALKSGGGADAHAGHNHPH